MVALIDAVDEGVIDIDPVEGIEVLVDVEPFSGVHCKLQRMLMDEAVVNTAMPTPEVGSSRRKSITFAVFAAIASPLLDNLI